MYFLWVIKITEFGRLLNMMICEFGKEIHRPVCMCWGGAGFGGGGMDHSGCGHPGAPAAASP